MKNGRLSTVFFYATSYNFPMVSRIKQLVSAKPLPLWAGLLSTLLFYLIYLATLAPDILTADNAEFQLIATNLGVAHPPGFPLYTMLAHLVTKLPVGPTAAFRVNLFSAITSTMTLAVVYAIVYRLTSNWKGSITAVFALGTATTFWAQATTANVRSLTALFAALTIYALLHFRENSTTKNGLIPATLAISFGITHHASLIFMGVIFGLFILIADSSFIKQPKRWIRPFLLSLLSLLPLLYIPQQAIIGAIRAPARLATWTGFWNHFLARGFSGDFFYFVQPTELWERLKVMGNVMHFQFNLFLLIGMLIGVLLMFKKDWKLACMLSGSFAVHTLVTATYRAPQTVEYMLPAYVPAIICLGYGVSNITLTSFKKLTPIYFILLFSSAIIQGGQNFPSFAQLHQDYSTHEYMELLLNQAPENSTILAHWHWVTPLWYLQEVEGQRTDINVEFVFPTAEEYPATWARRVNEELAKGRSVITTHYDANFYNDLPTPEPLHNGFLFRQAPLKSLPEAFVPATLNLGDEIEIQGFQLSQNEVSIGQEFVFIVAWQAQCPIDNCEPTNATMFVHLVSPDGIIFAQADVPIQSNGNKFKQTGFRLTPRLGAPIGTYQLLVGAYIINESGLVPLGEPRTTLASLQLEGMQKRPFTQNPVYYPTENGRTLIGYDWDTTLVDHSPRLYLHWQNTNGYITEIHDTPNPITLSTQFGQITIEPERSHYIPFGQGIIWTGFNTIPPLSPNSSITIRQIFHSQQPILADISTSIRLVGYAEDDFTWAWADLDEAFGVPAMGAIPTLKWINGSKIIDPHQFTIPNSAQPGQQVGILLNLYDTFTNRPIPVLDERFTPTTQWYSSTIEP